MRGVTSHKKSELRAQQMARRLRSPGVHSAQKSTLSSHHTGSVSASPTELNVFRYDVPSSPNVSTPPLFWLFRTLGLFMGGIQRYVLYGQYCSRGAGVLTLRLPSLCTWSRSLVLVSSELPCCHSVQGNSSKPCSQVSLYVFATTQLSR